MEIGSTEIIILNDLIHSTLKTIQMLRIDTSCRMEFHNFSEKKKKKKYQAKTERERTSFSHRAMGKRFLL